MLKQTFVIIFTFALATGLFANKEKIISLQEEILTNAKQIHEYRGQILDLRTEMLAIVKENKDKKRKEIKGLLKPKREEVKKLVVKIRELKGKNKEKRKEIKSIRQANKVEDVAPKASE